MYKRALELTIVIFFILSTSTVLFKTGEVTAVTASDWKAGRIIDDALFANKSAMSVDQIQAFLNGKVGTGGYDSVPGRCDTSGARNAQPYSSSTRAQYAASRGLSTTFTCLSNYYEVPKLSPGPGIPASNYGGAPIPNGAKSASQLIWDAAQRYNISPKVLLVTIQKESAGPLTTDDWPFHKQFTYAMGAHCPDSGPGGAANCDENYAGFSIQISESAALKRYYLDNMDKSWWPYKKLGNNNILYQNAKPECGSSIVNITTKATAALYTYTPYQPNQAALNNMYGTGDSCSAYGNRNFWRIFNDWFGPTIGPLIRTEASGKLYYSDGQNKYIVPSMDLVSEYGLGLSDVRFVSQAEMDALPAPTSPTSDTLTQVVKSNSDQDEDGGAIYLLSKGTKYQVSSMEQFNNFGFTASKLGYLPLSHLQRMPTSTDLLSDFLQAPNGLISKMEGGKKRVIFDPATFNQINPSGKVTSVTDFTLRMLTPGNPYIVGDAVLIGPDGRVWLYQDTSWFAITSMDVYNCWRLERLSNFRFANYDQVSTDSTKALTCLAKKDDNSQFLLNGSSKLPVQAEWGFSAFSQPLNRTIDAVPTSTTQINGGMVAKSSVGNLYVFENGKRRHIQTMQVFSELGKTNADIVSVGSSTLITIPVGPIKLSTGSLIVEPSGQVTIVNGQNRLQVTSHEHFDSFGLGSFSLWKLGASDLAGYAVAGDLPSYGLSQSNAVLVDLKQRWVIPSTLDGAYGIVRSALPTLDALILKGTTGQPTATRFIKSPSSGNIYYLENGNKRHVQSWAKLVELGGDNQIITLSTWRVNQFPNGTNI